MLTKLSGTVGWSADFCGVSFSRFECIGGTGVTNKFRGVGVGWGQVWQEIEGAPTQYAHGQPPSPAMPRSTPTLP